MKIRHILKSDDFTDILKSGAKAHGKKLSLYVKRCGDEEVHVGIVIAKRFVPRAVTRNYLRRLIYAYFRDLDGCSEQGIKIVVRVNGDLRGYKKRPLSSEIRETLKSLLIKQGLAK